MRAAYIAAIVVSGIAAAVGVIIYRRRHSDSVTANNSGAAPMERKEDAQTVAEDATATMAVRAVKGVLLADFLGNNRSPNAVMNTTTPRNFAPPMKALPVQQVTESPVTTPAKAAAMAIVPTTFTRH